MASKILILPDISDIWVNGVKLIAFTTIPDILPFPKKKLRCISKKVGGREFHVCDGQGQSDSNNKLQNVFSIRLKSSYNGVSSKN